MEQPKLEDEEQTPKPQNNFDQVSRLQIRLLDFEVEKKRLEDDLTKLYEKFIEIKEVKNIIRFYERLWEDKPKWREKGETSNRHEEATSKIKSVIDSLIEMNALDSSPVKDVSIINIPSEQGTIEIESTDDWQNNTAMERFKSGFDSRIDPSIPSFSIGLSQLSQEKEKTEEAKMDDHGTIEIESTDDRKNNTAMERFKSGFESRIDPSIPSFSIGLSQLSQEKEKTEEAKMDDYGTIEIKSTDDRKNNTAIERFKSGFDSRIDPSIPSFSIGLSQLSQEKAEEARMDDQDKIMESSSKSLNIDCVDLSNEKVLVPYPILTA